MSLMELANCTTSIISSFPLDPPGPLFESASFLGHYVPLKSVIWFFWKILACHWSQRNMLSTQREPNVCVSFRRAQIASASSQNCTLRMLARQIRRGLETIGTLRDTLDILIWQTPLPGLTMKFKCNDPIPKSSALNFISLLYLE